MRRTVPIAVGVVVAASCIPWLRHQTFFSVLVGITVLALAGFMLSESLRAVSTWVSNWRTSSAQSKWRLPISRKHILAVGTFLVLIGTLPHYATVLGGDYKLAVATAHQSSRFNDALGAPVREAWSSEGKATLEKPIWSKMLIPVQGTKRRGNLLALATKENGQWSLRQLNLELEQPDETIDLLSK